MGPGRQVAGRATQYFSLWRDGGNRNVQSDVEGWVTPTSAAKGGVCGSAQADRLLVYGGHTGFIKCTRSLRVHTRRELESKWREREREREEGKERKRKTEEGKRGEREREREEGKRGGRANREERGKQGKQGNRRRRGREENERVRRKGTKRNGKEIHPPLYTPSGKRPEPLGKRRVPRALGEHGTPPHRNAAATPHCTPRIAAEHGAHARTPQGVGVMQGGYTGRLYTAAIYYSIHTAGIYSGYIL